MIKYKNLWILILVISVVYNFVFRESLFAGGELPKNKIQVCFRCDDFFAVKDHPFREIYETKSQIISIFQKQQIPLTIGVIPDVHRSISENTAEFKRLTSDDDVAILLRNIIHNDNFEIAMHGLNHYPNAIAKDSEWIHLPLAEQRMKIKEGKAILSAALGPFNLMTFIPPWNSFDLNTLRALQENEFSYVSGDVGIVKNKPFTCRDAAEKKYFNLNMVPGTTSLLELKSVLNIARRDSLGTIVVVILHPYDFQEYRGTRIARRANYTLSDLDTILSGLKNDASLQFVRIMDLNPDNISPSRYTQACRFNNVLKLAKYIAPSAWLNTFGFSDKGIGYWMEQGRYLAEKSYHILYERILLLAGLFVIVISIFASFIIALFIKKYSSKIKFKYIHMAYGILLLVCLLVLEFKIEMITAPNLQGILILFLTGYLSWYVSSLLFFKLYLYKN